MRTQFSKRYFDHLDDTVMAVVGLIIGLIAFLMLTLIPFKARGLQETPPNYPQTSLSPSEAAGLEVQNVDPGSIYESMDLQSGDVLLELNRHRIQREHELQEIFGKITPGTEFEYLVRHNGKIQTRKSKVPLMQKTESVPRIDPSIKPRSPAPAATPISPFGPGQPQPDSPNPLPPGSAKPPAR